MPWSVDRTVHSQDFLPVRVHCVQNVCQMFGKPQTFVFVQGGPQIFGKCLETCMTHCGEIIQNGACYSVLEIGWISNTINLLPMWHYTNMALWWGQYEFWWPDGKLYCPRPLATKGTITFQRDIKIHIDRYQRAVFVLFPCLLCILQIWSYSVARLVRCATPDRVLLIGQWSRLDY